MSNLRLTVSSGVLMTNSRSRNLANVRFRALARAAMPPAELAPHSLVLALEAKKNIYATHSWLSFCTAVLFAALGGFLIYFVSGSLATSGIEFEVAKSSLSIGTGLVSGGAFGGFLLRSKKMLEKCAHVRVFASQYIRSEGPPPTQHHAELKKQAIALIGSRD